MTGRGQEGTFPRPPAGPGSTALGGPSTSLPARLAGARARARRTRRSGRAGAAPGRTRRLSQGRAPAALSAPERKARPRSPQTPAGHPRPRPRRALPAPGGACRGRCLEVPLRLPAQTWAGSAGAAEFRPFGRSPASRVPTPRLPPPPLLAASAPASEGRKVKEKQRLLRPGRSPRPVRPPPAGGSAPAPRGHSTRAR